MLQRFIAMVGRLFGGGAHDQRRREEGSALVGTWRLERFVDMPDGADPVYPYGTSPVGMFIFTSGGDASVNVMRSPHDETTPNPNGSVPPWYSSYFGTYTCDPVAGHWIIHVVGGNIPNYLGTDQRRPFKISGDLLMIAGTHVAADGKTARYERVLRRVRH